MKRQGLQVYRCLDLLLACAFLPIASLICPIIIIGCLLDTGRVFFRQVRVGRMGSLFVMYKFRTMHADAPSVPTHLSDPKYVSVFGRFLRHMKLDEIPQIFNVFLGDMSFVGPRPSLPGQSALVLARRHEGILGLRPGITGLAQISGVDMSDLGRLIALDKRMLDTMSVKNYFTYIIFTVVPYSCHKR